MDSSKASEILASALRDMDEIIRASEASRYFNDSFKNKSKLENDAKGDHLSETPNNETIRNDTCRNPKNDFDVHGKCAPLKKKYNPGEIPDGLSPENQKFLYQIAHSVESDGDSFGDSMKICLKNTTNGNNSEVLMNHNSSELSYPKLDEKLIRKEEEDDLQNRVVMLQNQVEKQACRIAELERNRNQKPSPDKPADLDKLDLLAVLSKQEVQISSLERAKRDLESQVKRLEQKLTELTVEGGKSARSDEMPSVCQFPSSDTGSIRKNKKPGNANSTNQNDYQLQLPTASDIIGSNGMIMLRPSGSNNKALDFTPTGSPRTPQLVLTAQQNSLTENRAQMHSSLAYPSSFNEIDAPHPIFPPAKSYQCKSASLNELYRYRTSMENNLYWKPVNTIGWNNYNRTLPVIPSSATPLPSNVYNSPVDEISAASPDQLPPQYASDYHRQAYLTTRALSPPPPRMLRNPFLSSDFRESGRFPAETQQQTDILHSSTFPPLPERGGSSSPLVRRTDTPNQVPFHLMTPPPIDRRSKASQLTDFTVTSAPYSSSTSTKTGRSSRIKRFFTENQDFSAWDKDMVSAWLYELGLGYVVPYARRWLRQGSDLIRASRKEVEQEMGIRNPLHLKKLFLHMQLRTKQRIAGYLAPQMILIEPPAEFNIPAWLDDLGLSAYTSAFDRAAVDSLVLNYFTLDDLLTLKLTNELHFLSLRRGLQMLRRIDFDLSRLVRSPQSDSGYSGSTRPRRRFDASAPLGAEIGCERSISPVFTPDPGAVPDDNQPTKPVSMSAPANLLNRMSGETLSSYQNASQSVPNPMDHVRSNPSPVQVCYWTQHRVVSWLNSIELPEYAPDLCGSGVHGALMVLEDRFNPDLLASILHIPPNKTLVRRHLASKFAELVGEDIWKRKQRARENPDVHPLTVNSKIKLCRKYGFFLSSRRRKGSYAEDELLCPIDIDSQDGDLFAQDKAPLDILTSISDSTSIQMTLQDSDWTPSQSMVSEPS
ncbi:unnamed protein product [Calicophoron daubneyi]|uniref:SAM domain-containing protein n=1 Tax=Calicophoron daubneyi TaxID=300641 RepID=A0AAV2TK19_CALDB